MIPYQEPNWPEGGQVSLLSEQKGKDEREALRGWLEAWHGGTQL